MCSDSFVIRWAVIGLGGESCPGQCLNLVLTGVAQQSYCAIPDGPWIHPEGVTAHDGVVVLLRARYCREKVLRIFEVGTRFFDAYGIIGCAGGLMARDDELGVQGCDGV